MSLAWMNTRVAGAVGQAINPADWVYESDWPDATYELACTQHKWWDYVLNQLLGRNPNPGPPNQRICGIQPADANGNLTIARALATAAGVTYLSTDDAPTVCQHIVDYFGAPWNV